MTEPHKQSLRRASLVWLGLFMLVLAVHHRAIAHSLVFDDLYFVDDILRQQSFRQFINLKVWHPTAVYRPLPHLLYYWPFRAVFGADAWKYQILTLSGHTLVAFLIYLIGSAIAPYSALPVLTAVLFSMNTVYSTESIWFTGFLEGQTGYIFGLAAFWLSLSWARRPLQHLVVCLLLLLGFVSYEPVVSLALLIAVSGLFLQRPGSRSLREALADTIPYATLAALYVWLRERCLSTAYSSSERWGPGWHVAHNYWTLVSHLVVPRNVLVLSNPYLANVDFVRQSGDAMSSAALIGAALVYLAYLAICPTRWNLFFALWSAVTLLPYVFVKSDIDTRWTYITSAGVLGIVSSALLTTRAMMGRSGRLRRVRLLIANAPILIVCSGFAVGSYRVTQWFGDVGQREARTQLSVAIRAFNVTPRDALYFFELPMPMRFIRQVIEEVVPQPGASRIAIVEIDRQAPLPIHHRPGRALLYLPDAADPTKHLVEITSDLLSVDEKGICARLPQVGKFACSMQPKELRRPE